MVARVDSLSRGDDLELKRSYTGSIKHKVGNSSARRLKLAVIVESGMRSIQIVVYGCGLLCILINIHFFQTHIFCLPAFIEASGPGAIESPYFSPIRSSEKS